MEKREGDKTYILKASTRKWHCDLLTFFFFLKEVTWPCLSSNGKKSKTFPQEGDPYVGGVNLPTYAHHATCVFIFLEFFDRINSYQTPLTFY